MNKKSCFVLMALAFACASSFAAKERVVRFENQVRLGYDDNIYQQPDKQGSGFITDIINLSTKLNFSSRTDALLYWQPEFRYRFDAEPKFATYQDFYARLNHALSQRAFLTLSDRFRYQLKEGQTGIPGGGTADTNQNYIENDLLGALDYTLNTVSYLKVGAGYEFRIWDDDAYGEGDRNNNYDQITANGSYIRQLKPNKTEGMLGANYNNLEYAGNRGGYDAIAVFGGVDQNFNPHVTGYGRLGASFSSIDGGSGGNDTDNTSPYVQAGLEVNPTARTSFNGSLGYSLSRADNSVYNAQDRFNLGLGVRHDLTAKVSLASALGYTYSYYDGTYARVAGEPDFKDHYLTFTLRASYQINRNNFVDAGYLFADRSTDSSDWDRNRVDVAWRLNL